MDLSVWERSLYSMTSRKGGRIMDADLVKKVRELMREYHQLVWFKVTQKRSEEGQGRTTNEWRLYSDSTMSTSRIPIRN